MERGLAYPPAVSDAELERIADHLTCAWVAAALADKYLNDSVASPARLAQARHHLGLAARRRECVLGDLTLVVPQAS